GSGEPDGEPEIPPTLEEMIAIVRVIAEQVASNDVPVDEPLFAAGLDSLGAVELRNALQVRLGLADDALPVSLVFEHPTVGDVADFLVAYLEDQARQGVVLRIKALAPMTAEELEQEAEAEAFEERMAAEEAAHEIMDLSDVTAQVHSVLGTMVGRSVGGDEPLAAVGLDSLGSVELARELSARFSVELLPTTVFDNATPDHLAEHVLELQSQSSLQREDSRRSLSGRPPRPRPSGGSGVLSASAVAAAVEENQRNEERQRAVEAEELQRAVEAEELQRAVEAEERQKAVEAEARHKAAAAAAAA
ncbi:hypothetical protein H632_c4219p0, partial [Helicosporidium sp. ATCC 50920]